MTISGIARGSARWAMAGYWVDQAWAGRGLAPISLALAADHLFFTLRLHRLEVAIRPENAKSLRVVEKLGLRYEGERARYLHVDGDWRDHLMFAIHADEVGPGGLIGRLGR
jgi:ribosomal-protein-alanine N-acetyltransferase